LGSSGCAVPIQATGGVYDTFWALVEPAEFVPPGGHPRVYLADCGGYQFVFDNVDEVPAGTPFGLIDQRFWNLVVNSGAIHVSHADSLPDTWPFP